MEERKAHNLTARHRSEREFHDFKAGKCRQVDFYREGGLQHAHDMLVESLGNVSGKEILDLGCGRGAYSVYYSERGAKVVGLDISIESLRHARRRAEEQVPNASIGFVLGSGENIPMRKQFDVVAGVAILHHLDLELAVKSIERSLRYGGMAVFIEPLAHSPLVNIYRKLTPGRRTRDERPLSVDWINSLGTVFRQVRIRGFGFLSLLSFAFVPFRQFALFRFANGLLSELDQKLFKVFPRLQRFCWGAVIQLRK